METALPAVVLQQHHGDKCQSYVSVECVHQILFLLLDLIIEVYGRAIKNPPTDGGPHLPKRVPRVQRGPW
jgi:hypothetical protein